jgi:hypothetical protein
MSNVTLKGITFSAARKNPHVIAPMRMGFIDAMNGAPYAPAYETAKQWWQQNYNQGRLVALECKVNGINAKWPANTILPKSIEQISQHVARELRRNAAEGC